GSSAGQRPVPAAMGTPPRHRCCPRERRFAMPTKKKSAKDDRSLIEGGEDYPVRELAVATGIPLDEAEALAEKHGAGTDKAAKAARGMQREDAANDDKPA